MCKKDTGQIFGRVLATQILGHQSQILAILMFFESQIDAISGRYCLKIDKKWPIGQFFFHVGNLSDCIDSSTVVAG